MKTDHKPPGIVSSQEWDRLVHKCLAPLALFGGLGIILYSTLKDFDFHFKRLSTAEYITGFQILPSSNLDFPRNVLLFMPFGFGFAALLDDRGWPKKGAFYLTLLAGFFLTLLVESLQFFLPGRAPTVSDLLANSLGAVVGWGCYRLWQQRTAVFQKVKAAVLVPRNMMMAGAIYLLLLLAIGIFLQNSTRLTAWDSDFTMLLGNEQTGDRPWSGSVTGLAVLDRAISADEAQKLLSGVEITDVAGSSLVATYPLINSSPFSDQGGNLPDLIWQGETDSVQMDEVPQFDQYHWLESELPVSYLTERLQMTSQFTIMMTVATADLQQSGPARILTVSVDPFLRNLMLGQEGDDLILRVRTPLTGENGGVPELVFADIFSSKAPQKLIVSFDGLAAKLYSADSKRARRVEIVPGLAFFRSLMVSEVFSLRMGVGIGLFLMFIFYVLFFIPLGILLALIAKRIDQPLRRRWLLILGIGLPPLLLEIILSSRTGFELRLLNVFLGMVVTGITFLILTLAARQSEGLGRSS